MKSKNKLSKSEQTDKQIGKIFQQRQEILRGFGNSGRVPKQPHYMTATKR